MPQKQQVVIVCPVKRKFHWTTWEFDTRYRPVGDDLISRARVQLADASVAAAPDVNARMRVLDGYAAVVRSLGRAIEESEEATR